MNTPTNHANLQASLSSLQIKIQSKTVASDSQELLCCLEHAFLLSKRASKDYQNCEKKMKEFQQQTNKKANEIKKLEKKLKNLIEQKKSLQDKIDTIHVQKKNGSTKIQHKYRQLQRSYAQLLQNLAEHTQMDQITAIPNLTVRTSGNSIDLDNQQINIWQQHNTQIINKLKEEKQTLVSQLDNLKFLYNDLDKENQCLHCLIDEYQLFKNNMGQQARDQPYPESFDEANRQSSSETQEESSQEQSDNQMDLAANAVHMIPREESDSQDIQIARAQVYFGFWREIKKSLGF